MRTLKHLIGLALFALLLACFSNCSSTKSNIISFEAEPPFNLSNAYVQDWTTSIQENANGTNIVTTFSEIPEDVIIENFYFKDKVAPALRYPTFRDQYTGHGNQYRANFLETKRDPSAVDAISPFTLEDQEIVISYRLEGKKTVHYFKLPNIHKKPETAFPERGTKEVLE